MLMSRQAISPVGGRLRPADHRGDRRLARPGRTGDAAHLQRHVVQQAEVRPALPDRQPVGGVTIGAQRSDAEFSDALGVFGVRRLAQGQKGFGAGVIGLAPEFRFVRGAAARQTADRVAKPAAAEASGGGIEGRHRGFFLQARNMRGHAENAVDLVVEGMAAVGDDGVFVLIGGDRDAVERLLKQIGGGRRVDRERFRPNRGREPGIDLVKRKDHIEGLGVEPRQHALQADEIEP